MNFTENQNDFFGWGEGVTEKEIKCYLSVKIKFIFTYICCISATCRKETSFMSFRAAGKIKHSNLYSVTHESYLFRTLCRIAIAKSSVDD